MGQGTECTDRPTEVSVIRFVSRNRTIEEIAPKKEIFTCKQQGCGKIFTNHDEFRTHEALEELKIRFICREPGCGQEMPDPGTMWRHYQECHSNETNAFVCPYTSCGSHHNTSDNLTEHIENCHRQPPALPTEPEIICFEVPASVTNIDDDDDDDNTPRTTVEDDDVDDCGGGGGEQDEQDDHNDTCQQNDNDKINIDNDTNRFIKSSTRKNINIITNKNLTTNHDDIYKDERLIKTNICDKNITTNNKDNNIDDYSSNTEYITSSHKIDNNHDTTFYHNNVYDDNIGNKNNDDNDNIMIDNNDKTKLQDHRIDLGNLESVFRSGLEGDVKKIEVTNDASGNCSDDEEYTPKKQRMSRFKKEEQPYKCDINGCGKMYKYISHYRHHQDSHKIQETITKQLPKSPNNKTKSKASTVSFFLCKIPGCGAQVNNVTSLWKHYQENHANAKATVTQSTKLNQTFR